MAKPSWKSEGMEREITRMFGVDRRKVIEDNKCAFCGENATTFRDSLSAKEYTISGLCQRCQDATFGGP